MSRFTSCDVCGCTIPDDKPNPYSLHLSNGRSSTVRSIHLSDICNKCAEELKDEIEHIVVTNTAKAEAK